MKPSLPPLVRRLVLGAALLAALAVGALPDAPRARAATASQPVIVAQESSTAKEIADAIREATREARQEIAKEAEKAAADAARAARDARAAAEADAESAAALRRKGVNIGVGGVDRQYDSFDQFLDRDPGLAFLVMGIVFIMFLTPILIIALVVWYKIRRNRMQNETMLKLAEKGIVPPVEALQGVGSRAADATLVRAASALPPAEQVQVLTKRAAWSDLRKGVIMGTIGLALTFHGLIEDGSPGWFGLILLFVGLGYVALWYFEERQAADTVNALRGPASPPPPGP